MRNLALTIEYDGTEFHGWQIQPGQRTVEGELQKALEAVTRAPVKLFAASRTDAGVHAHGQSASFTTECALPTARIQGALSQILPEDIVVLDIVEKPEAFNARYDAKAKWYRYQILCREIPPALERHYFLHVKEKLRLVPMRKAAELLLGTHDFSSFGVNSGKEQENTLKTIYRLAIDQDTSSSPPFCKGGLRGVESRITIDIVGDSFLYRMVRSIVGTLLEIGKGKRKPESISDILKKKDRCAAGITVPPQGLCLMRVFYGEDLTAFLSST